MNVIMSEGIYNSSEVYSQFSNVTPPLISSGEYTALAIFMFSIFLSGIVFNGLFVYVFLVHEKLKTRPNILLIALCVSSFLIASLAIPFVGASALSKKWLFGRFGCIFHGFVVTALGLTQIAILTVLSVDKYIVIVKSHWSHLVTKSATLLLLFGCVIYGCLLATYPLLGWNKYTLEEANISCSIDWTGRSPSDVSYSVCLLIIGLVVPLGVMAYVYISILVLIKKQKTISVKYKGMKQHHRTSRREVKVMKTIFLLVSAFVISWLPYSVYAVLSILGYADKVHPLVGTIPSIFAKASIIWNPLIYVCRNRSFKKALFDTFPCMLAIYKSVYRCRKKNRHDSANESTRMVDLQIHMTSSSRPSEQMAEENFGSCFQETAVGENCEETTA